MNSESKLGCVVRKFFFISFPSCYGRFFIWLIENTSLVTGHVGEGAGYCERFVCSENFLFLNLEKRVGSNNLNFVMENENSLTLFMLDVLTLGSCLCQFTNSLRLWIISVHWVYRDWEKEAPGEL